MSWARFDDRTPHHRKVKRLSDAAFRLWFTSVCYCAEYLTDGFIDAADVPEMPKVATGKKLDEAIRELESSGLWEVVEGSGWQVHDYLDWNPNGEAVKAKKQARSEAGRRGGQSSGKSRGKTEANSEAIASTLPEQTGSKTEAKSNPVPVPVPVPKAADAALSGDAATERPKNLASAMKFPVGDRSRYLKSEEHMADWIQPQAWPELQAFAETAHQVMGLSAPRLGSYGRDSGVRALVELFAIFTPGELAAALGAVQSDPFFKSKRGLSSFTPEVVRRLLDARPSATVSTQPKRQPDYPGEQTFRIPNQEIAQ